MLWATYYRDMFEQSLVIAESFHYHQPHPVLFSCFTSLLQLLASFTYTSYIRDAYFPRTVAKSVV